MRIYQGHWLNHRAHVHSPQPILYEMKTNPLSPKNASVPVRVLYLWMCACVRVCVCVCVYWLICEWGCACMCIYVITSVNIYNAYVHRYIHASYRGASLRIHISNNQTAANRDTCHIILGHVCSREAFIRVSQRSLCHVFDRRRWREMRRPKSYQPANKLPYPYAYPLYIYRYI